MGVWGSGLYSGDFAADLRSAIAAVTRLPLDGDQLLNILCDIEPAAAYNSDDEDHTTFWLVVADKFAKLGISCERLREKALNIIERGDDIAMLMRLGMNPSGLKRRREMLTELRGRITASLPPNERRSVLKKPQPFLMEIGDVLVYPTSNGCNINPYFKSKQLMVPHWEPDGWSSAIIVDAGRAFDFLAWYRPLTLFTAQNAKPDLARLRSLSPWVLKHPGTCSAVHFKRLELEKIGNLPVDSIKLRSLFPEMGSGNCQAINGISISKELKVGTASCLKLISGVIVNPFRPGLKIPTISYLEDLLS